MKRICGKCGKPAKWYYMPGHSEKEDYACDKHVPRGCSCNAELKKNVAPILDKYGNLDNPAEDWYEPTDFRGRKYPCCEWFYSKKGYSYESKERN